MEEPLQRHTTLSIWITKSRIDIAGLYDTKISGVIGIRKIIDPSPEASKISVLEVVKWVILQSSLEHFLRHWIQGPSFRVVSINVSFANVGTRVRTGKPVSFDLALTQISIQFP